MLMTCLKEMGKNNVILIADKGYSSKANREWMTKNGIMYIAPLKRDNASIDYSPLKLSTMSGFEGVFKYHGRPIFYRTVQKMGQRAGRPSKDDPNNVASVAKEHVVLFFDQVLRSKEIMDAVGRNSDFAEIAERSPRMGTLTLATNSPLISGPEELYDTYKEREAIEDMNDAYKNVLGKNASHLQDPASYQGWLFVNHISLMLYYRVHNKIKAAGKVSSFSVEDVMDMARRLTIQKIGDQWLDHPGTKTNLSKLTEIFGDSIPKIDS